MDMGFFKWTCEKAEGFKFHEEMNDVECPDQMYIACDIIEKNRVRYPLLLQRAIEGVNKNSRINTDDLCIKSEPSSMSVETNNPYPKKVEYLMFGNESYDHFKTIDEAKEAILRFIYEQEKKIDS